MDVDGVQEQDQCYSIFVIGSQHVHYLEVASALSIVVSSSCFQSLVFLRVMMTPLILL